ncbi:MAG TPA: hypothetical protein DDX92_06620 [Flavobacteriales bacterium]|nr:hypothetical protein [Flavobacteriales bacterium]
MYAQENNSESTTATEEQKTAVKKDKPVRTPWNSGLIMGGKTSIVPGKGTLRFELVHLFGSINNGFSDLFGVYADGANVRMGLSYVPVKNLQIGVGVTRFNITTDLNLKYTVLEQTRKNTMPVSVTLYGNMAFDGSDKEAFGTDYSFSHRMSYFSQLIVGRKFGKYVTVQASGSFSHFNSMPDGVNHDVIGIGASAKIRVTSRISIVSHNDFPLNIESISEYSEFETAKPNYQLGAEIITTSHAFQIYLSTSNFILGQNVYARNQNELDSEGIRIGFLMTKL